MLIISFTSQKQRCMSTKQFWKSKIKHLFFKKDKMENYHDILKWNFFIRLSLIISDLLGVVVLRVSAHIVTGKKTLAQSAREVVDKMKPGRIFSVFLLLYIRYSLLFKLLKSDINQFSFQTISFRCGQRFITPKYVIAYFYFICKLC